MLNEETILVKNDAKPSRKYLKSTIIEPDITLNEMASDFYELINGENSIKKICLEILNDYDVEYETCLDDAIELFEMLMDYEVLGVKENTSQVSS